MDLLKTTIDSIRKLKRGYFNEQFLPVVIEHKRRNDSQFSNLLEQLWSTESILCHFSSSNSEAHWPLLQELDCVVGRAVTLVKEVCVKSKDWTGRREHYLEVFLDLRWWTWVLVYNAPLRSASHGERFLVTPKGVLDPSSSRLPSFMQKLYLWWSSSYGYARHLPSYGIEVFVKETEGLSSLVAWLKTESGEPLDTTRNICSASAEIFIIEGKVLVPVLYAQKPSWMGEEFKVDLTQVFLGMSSSGLVIKCEDSGTEYALKRVQSLDQRQPVIARLCHPHIVELMSYWRENGFLFVMMEFMEGDFKDLIKRRLRVTKLPFTMNVVLDFLLQIAKAMLYLHDLGVTHPHLKSSDVLYKEAAGRSKVDKNDTKYLVKLGDFQFYSKNDFKSMVRQNVYQFGLICLEVLSTEPLHWELEETKVQVNLFNYIQSRLGYAIPGSLTQCITRCLDGSIKFSEVVVMLLLAQLEVFRRATKEPSPRSLDREHTLLAKHQGTLSSPESSSRFTTITEMSVENAIERSKAHSSQPTRVTDAFDSDDEEVGEEVAEVGKDTSVQDEIEQLEVHVSELVEHVDSKYWTVAEDLSEPFWEHFDFGEGTSIVDEIERSKVHWSQRLLLHSREVAEVSNVEVFKVLQRHPTWGHFFCTFGDGGINDVGELLVGEMFAEGGQAELYHVHINWKNPEARLDDVQHGRSWVLKVFKKGTSLLDLQRQWPLGMFRLYEERVECGKPWKFPSLKNILQVHCGTLLQDGRFAFLLMEATEDLRTLIDRKMKTRIDPNCGPFSMADATNIMYCVARGMVGLHNHNIVHRDLKASNILCIPLRDNKDMSLKYDIQVADFECSIGVEGTGFFRAPETLQAIRDKALSRQNVFTKATDVYTYGMLCYEILTGRVPFEGHPTNDYNLVLKGQRPKLPDHVDKWAHDLLHMCWQSDPATRPTFGEILDLLEANPKEKSKGWLKKVMKKVMYPRIFLKRIQTRNQRVG